ncbi:MAG TPA: hypothetical protein VJB90_00645 [Candidatus Nanoarchaeia archaeon]|nr:hypothetical protein [Candidatus Nanoarchaeia archaeon]
MARAKSYLNELRMPVFFLSLYWFLIAYVITNLIIFLKYSTERTYTGFIKQILFINLTYDLSSLLIIYSVIIIIASLFSLLIIYIEKVRLVILIGGSVMGIFLAVFAYVMSLYYGSQPCEVSGCSDIQYKLFIIYTIYFIYGNFIASQIPVAYALAKDSASIGEFFRNTLKPGLVAIGVYAILGLVIVFSLN